MINKLLGKVQYLFKSDDQEVELTTPHGTDAEFELIYKKLIIGTLKPNDAVWSFEYSDNFKNQSDIKPIVDFPDKYKIYQSVALFPFFAFRIPSLQRLKIQKLVSENITNDEVTLLKMFGKRSIANPYELKPQI